MFREIKEHVYHALSSLYDKGLIAYTWGNVSEIDHSRQYMAIKPSGLDLNHLHIEDIVIVDIKTGKVVEGDYKPSSDTSTHLELYRRFDTIGGIVHSHSTNAVAFSQAGMDIPILGTTHADYFSGSIPCTRPLCDNEMENDYEINTGRVIIETIERRGYDPMSIPGIVVRNHGPFSWGVDAEQAVFYVGIMEIIAEMSFKTLCLNPNSEMPAKLIEKHWHRKNGPLAYYGQ